MKDMGTKTELLKLAKEKFGETLTKAEIKLLDKVAIAELADYSTDEECNLRAVVIEWLCYNKKAAELVTHRGICLKEANIEGLVNLAYLNIQFPLCFEKCNIPEQIELHSARLRELYMGGCHIGSLSGYGLEVEGHIFLRNGFEANGEVNFTGATIEGDFDCSNGHFIHPDGIAIDLNRARVNGNIIFTNDFKSKGVVVMVDSHIEGSLICKGGKFTKSDKGKMAINASGLKCGGDVLLKGGFRAEGEVTFSGGTVAGNLDCFESEFSNHSGDALNAEALNVGGGIFLMGNFKGEVRLLGVTVGQSLECHGGVFDKPKGYTINADSANIAGSVFLRNGFKSNGKVNLIGAKIGGDIDCEKGHFTNPNDFAIHADEIEVGGSIFLRHGFMAEGIVSFTGGRIKVNLDCGFGQFINKIGPALWAEGLNVEGSVFLCSRFSDDQTDDNMPKQLIAEGGISFQRAVIGGAFDCGGSQFINHGGYAITCSGIKVGGNVYLCNSLKSVKQKKEASTSYQVFRAKGQVNFSNAKICGTLDCNGGEFINKGKDRPVNKGENVALNLDFIKVDDSIMLSNNFHAEGQVNLLGAEIGGQLNCVAGRFINPVGIAFVAEGARIGGSVFLCGSDYKGGESRETASENNIRIEGKVLLNGIEVKKCFLWCKVDSPEKVSLDLQHATIGSLWDEKESWPKKDKLFLHGLIYHEISDKASKDSKVRKEWLCKQPKYMPQPYEQLAEVLKRGGHGEEARKVLIAKEDDKLTYNIMGKCAGFWHRMYGLSLDYGYYTWKPLKWGIFIIIFGAIFFWACKGLLTPTKVETYASGNSNTKKVKVSDDYPTFQALAYSADVFIPVIDLQQAKHWIPNANKGRELYRCKWFTIASGGLLLFWQWMQTLLGWVLTTMLIFGLTRLARR